MTDASNNPRHPVARNAIALGVIALLGTALLAWVNSATKPRIAEQERRQLLDQLEQVVPADRFNNAMHEDFILVSDTLAFPGGQQAQVFRARQQGVPAAVAMKFYAIDGYNGRIDLIVGILADGQVSGVRVLQHRETPGLGDGIELRRSDWILSFNGRSLDNTAAEDWTVQRDGGDFDQFTGATITPRAVVRAVHRALEYFEGNQEALFSRPSEFAASEEAER